MQSIGALGRHHGCHHRNRMVAQVVRFEVIGFFDEAGVIRTLILSRRFCRFWCQDIILKVLLLQRIQTRGRHRAPQTRLRLCFDLVILIIDLNLLLHNFSRQILDRVLPRLHETSVHALDGLLLHEHVYQFLIEDSLSNAWALLRTSLYSFVGKAIDHCFI